MPARWEHFEHEADVGLRAYGESEPEVFVGLATALTAVITDPAAVRPAVPVEIKCEAPARDLLLIDWLNALIYEMAIRRMLFGTFDVRLDKTHLHAIARGETVDRLRHHPAVEVKGATYTALQFARLPDGEWMGQCVVDV
jgi:tRNA nucleotidyltransferase (CCA-adding enzyme)